ncbi:hypothetical protein K470DRAFT_291421, partial [Piedraia hortae CBS 480.64]
PTSSFCYSSSSLSLSTAPHVHLQSNTAISYHSFAVWAMRTYPDIMNSTMTSISAILGSSHFSVEIMGRNAAYGSVSRRRTERHHATLCGGFAIFDSNFNVRNTSVTSSWAGGCRMNTYYDSYVRLKDEGALDVREWQFGWSELSSRYGKVERCS